ncbi:MAG TPA: TIR domain-containing protein [Ktedonobacteraceae bacterium]
MPEQSEEIISSSRQEMPIPQRDSGQVISQTKPKLTSVKVFYCYAREDDTLCMELNKHLMALKQRGWISSWNEQEILAGMEREHEIDVHLSSADIILLLVSSDFMNSEYCYSIGMQEAMKRHETGEAVVIPIILRPVDWQDTPFGKLQALPTAGKPITIWPNRDEALLVVEQGIRAAVKALLRRVFISFAPADNTFAMHLKSDLEARGFTVWSTPDGQGADGVSRENIVQPLIRDAEAVLLVASPSARYDRSIKEDLRIAEMYQQRVVPVWAAGDDWLEAIPSAWDESSYVDAREQHYELAIQKLIARLELLTPTSVPVITTPSLVDSSQGPEPDTEPRNPFKGLEPFRSGDARDFFGRDGFVQDLLKALEDSLFTGQQAKQAGRLLAVVGPSGSGKSSIVMAGLLPELQKGAIAGSSEWTYLKPVKPGALPFEALAQTLASSFPERSLISLQEDLKADSARGLHLLASQIAKRPDSKVVLLVDQFEELFTLTTSKDEQQRFIDVLVAAITEPHGPVVVILTLRADFYDRPIRYPELARLIEKHHRLVLPMDIKDLRSVIEGPAKLPDVRLNFEGDLLGDLLFEVQGQVGALPLLQFTLDQLFQRRSGHLLTLKAYQELGGVKGSVSKKAEETYAALETDEHRKLARALFMRLIDPGATEQDTTRRRAALAELLLTDPKQTQWLQDTADAFVKARLLTTDEVAGTPSIEVSHEALIREWSRLSGWLREARDDFLFQKSLSEDVMEWERRKRPRGRLYRDDQLKEAQKWARRNMPNEQEAAFLRVSATQRNLSIVSVIVVVLLLLSSTGFAGWYFFFQPSKTLVTTLQDNVVGSLRWCIDNAPSGSTITFTQGLRRTIWLTGGNLEVGGSKQLTIRGPGADQMTISGGVTDSNIHVSKGATLNISGLSFKDSETRGFAFLYNEGTLAVTNSTISDNKTITATTSYGGGIENNTTGTLTVKYSIISNNVASGDLDRGLGGGIDNEGKLTVIHSTFLNNRASSSSGTAWGGGIRNYEKGTLKVIDSTFSGNSAKSDQQNGLGGGIHNENRLTVIHSTFLNNRASSSSDSAGGGISNNLGGTVMVTDSTFSGNTASSSNSNSYGGGIFNISTGTFTVTDSTFSGNLAKSDKQNGQGGGIHNEGKLTVTSSTFSNNSASGINANGFGGGIDNYSKGNLMVTDSTFSGNLASGKQNGQGGGIENDGKLTATYSTFSNNSASGSSTFGGGIVNDGTGTVTNSTFSGNKSSGKQGGQGGGIDDEGKLTVINSTFWGNTARGGSDFGGGGISVTGVKGSFASIRFSTLYGNSSSTGGGIWVDPKGSSHLMISSSIVSANNAHDGPDISGALLSDGYNLIENVAGATGLNARTDRQVTLSDLKIDSMLGNNGGPAHTLALLQGSQAIDAVPLQACSITVTDVSGHTVTITTDQRGDSRPDGSENACDIGAYESS